MESGTETLNNKYICNINVHELNTARVVLDYKIEVICVLYY